MQPEAGFDNVMQNDSPETSPDQISPKRAGSSTHARSLENPYPVKPSYSQSQIGSAVDVDTPCSRRDPVTHRAPAAPPRRATEKLPTRIPVAIVEEAPIIPRVVVDPAEEKDTKVVAPKMKADADVQEKRKVYPVQAATATIKLWQEILLPHLERILEHHLPKNESASIDLLGIGTSRENSRPTIVITCQSIQQLKGHLRKQFVYDNGLFDLKIRKGEVRRSTGRRAREIRNPRSARRSTGSFIQDCPNRAYQERPLSGASIGACLDGRPLPPGTYGGLILVDGKPYGMTVHHLLDPECEEEGETDDDTLEDEEEEYQDGSEGFDPDDSSHLTMSPSNSDVSLISVIICQNPRLTDIGRFNASVLG